MTDNYRFGGPSPYKDHTSMTTDELMVRASRGILFRFGDEVSFDLDLPVHVETVDVAFREAGTATVRRVLEWVRDWKGRDPLDDEATWRKLQEMADRLLPLREIPD